MPHYVNIGAVGIQRYLARSRRLDGRRTASAALVAATSELDVAALLAGRAERNVEAGKIDGVLSLTLTDPADLDDVVRIVLREMRGKLPGAEFQVVEAEADTYLEALTGQLKPRMERGDVRLDLPAGAEFPGAAACEVCGSGTAASTVDLGEDGFKLACADCVMRHPARDADLGRTPENRLAERLGTVRVGGFDELSRIGESGGDLRPKHLATVYADGNKLGRFFGELAQHATGDTVPAAARAMSECTFEALVAATSKISPSRPGNLWALPHIVGGDDVLVTVPAARGWEFAHAFIREFRRLLGIAAERLGIGGVELPTMSAGLVFTQANFSFAQVIELADDCLKRAKSAGAGEREHIAFHDAVDSATTPGPALDVNVLHQHQEELRKLRDVLRKGQPHRLREQWRKNGPEGARMQATRLGHAEVVAPFLPGDAGEPDIELPDALTIARRWSW